MMMSEKINIVNSAILKMENISMTFGKVKALKSVNFTVRQGEIHSVIGPNGAGQTVLMNCINGIYRQHSGNVYYENKKINTLKPNVRAKLGISWQSIEIR